MEESELKTTVDDVSLSSSCPEYELDFSHGKTMSGIHTPTVHNLLCIYEKLIQFVQRKDFDHDLRKELNNAVKADKGICKAEPCREEKSDDTHKPEYIEEFTTRMKDLERMECGITITGETSSGKTSLMNKLVGNMLVTPRHLPATSRIVRIRNSEKLMYRILDKKGNKVLTEAPGKTKKMREKLDKYTTDESSESGDFHYIDVYCPFKSLQVQGNIMLVDTPGIGETDKMTDMLLEYLPNSFAFIFLIDVSRAGGVQKDRILKILETIIKQKSKMPCFELEDVLFVTNKWNHIAEVTEDQEEDESDDEEISENDGKKSEKEKTWNVIVNKLREVWPSINIDKVYKLNLQKVTDKNDTEEERLEFSNFCRELTEMLEKNKNKRKKTHLRYLDKTVRRIENGILARINSATGDDKDQIKMLHSTLEELDKLKDECVKIREILRYQINAAVESLAKKVSTFLHSEEGKEKILNPSGKKRVEKSHLTRMTTFHRIEKGIKQWLKGPEVLQKVNEIENQISDYFRNVKCQIKSAQLTINGELQSPLIKLETSDIFLVVLTSPIWFTGSVILGTLGLVAGTFLSPVIFWSAVAHTDADRKSVVTDCYNRYLQMWETEDRYILLRSILKEHFDKKIKAIFEDELPREIDNTASLINNLLQKRGYTKERYETFLHLKIEIQKLKSDVSIMLSCFEEK